MTSLCLDTNHSAVKSHGEPLKDSMLPSAMSEMPHGDSSPPAVHGGWRSRTPWMFLLILLNSALVLAAFIMAAYATTRVNNFTTSSLTALSVAGATGSVVTSTSRSSLPGYQLAGSLFAGTGYWFPADDMLYQRSDHAAVAFGSYMYLFGGVTNGSSIDLNGTAATQAVVLNATVKYYTPNGASYRVADMPEPRFRFGYGVLNNSAGHQLLYIFGGLNVSSNDLTYPSASTMVYNFNLDLWTLLPATSNLNIARSDLAGAGVSGKVYAAGGWDQTFARPLSQVEEFDPATRKWSFVANLTVPRGDAKAAVLDGQFYVMGGVAFIQPPGVNCDEDFTACNPFSAAVEAFNPATGQWARRKDMTFARGDFAAEALPNGRILTAGGEIGNGTQNQFASHFVEMYMAADDAWVTKAPLPSPRFRYDMAQVDHLVYVSGGAPSCDDYSPVDVCYNQNLKTVVAYFDIEYPSLWAYVKSPTSRS